MDRLEEAFTRLTACAPHRAAGSNYAGRTLVYEDCRRDLDLELGSQVLDKLGPPLSLLLSGLRWVSFEIATRSRSALDAMFERLVSGNSGTVEMAVFQQELLAQNGEPLLSVVRDVQATFGQRWRDLLRVDTDAPRVEHRVADLGARVAALFDVPGAGWQLVRYASPDVMIAADHADDVREGRFQLVLGELHIGNTLMWSFFLTQHERPRDLIAAAAADLTGAVILPVIPGENRSQRVNIPLADSSAFVYEFASGFSGCPPERVLKMADLVLWRDGGVLYVGDRNRQRRFDIIEFLGVYFNGLWVNRFFDLSSGGRHTPRVAIDDLVVIREQWQFAPGELTFAVGKTIGERFLLARQWARSHGLPRYVFVRLPNELKPVYVDLESPIYVDDLARMARGAMDPAHAAAQVSVVEMLPTPDQAWLTDANGNRYTSELRIVALDGRPIATPA
jgi:hypothetical protein